MHLDKGMIENAIEMIFKLFPYNKIRKTKGERIDCTEINAMLRASRVPSELSRRPRPINEGQIKCEEQRNYALVFLPLFAEAIGPERRDAYELWLHLAFLIKANTIPGPRIPITGLI
jgi:hypothetical protein